MNNQKGFANIALIVLVVMLALVAGYFTLVKRVEQPTSVSGPTTLPAPIQSPKFPTPTPTPTSKGGTGSVNKTGTVTIQPEDPNKAGLAPYPDLSFILLPTEPVSVKFVVEHRSALNGKTITIRGVVVGTLLGEKACPPDRGMCAQPSIFLADTTGESRNKLYDLRMLVSEEEQESNYLVGKTVVVQVVVDGSKVAVVARKTY